MKKLNEFINKNNINEGKISDFLAKLVSFIAKGKIKSIYNNLQNPELVKATKNLEKTILDYNKNYIDNPKYQEELKKLGLEIPDLKDLLN